MKYLKGIKTEALIKELALRSVDIMQTQPYEPQETYSDDEFEKFIEYNVKSMKEERQYKNSINRLADKIIRHLRDENLAIDSLEDVMKIVCKIHYKTAKLK